MNDFIESLIHYSLEMVRWLIIILSIFTGFIAPLLLFMFFWNPLFFICFVFTIPLTNTILEGILDKDWLKFNRSFWD